MASAAGTTTQTMPEMRVGREEQQCPLSLQSSGRFGAAQPPAATGQEAMLAAKVLARNPAAFLGGILLGMKKKAWPK